MGEPGVLLIRAKGNLNVYGSINDGFAPPLSTDEDSRAWRLVGRLATNNPNGVDLWQQSIIVPKSITLRGAAAGVTTTFPNVEGESLNFDAPLRSSVIKARVRMPTEVQLELFQPARWHGAGRRGHHARRHGLRRGYHRRRQPAAGAGNHAGRRLHG